MVMRYLIVLALTFQLAPIRADAQRRPHADDTIVRALVPVFAASLDSVEGHDLPNITAWRIEARAVSPATRRLLREAILAKVHGRVPASADTLAHFLGVDPVEVHGDSADVVVDHGLRWCTHGWPTEGGMTYVYVLRRVGGVWQYRSRREHVAYDPSPASLPGQKLPGCNLAVDH